MTEVLLCRYCLFSIIDFQRAAHPEDEVVTFDFDPTSPAVAHTIADGDALCGVHFSAYITNVATAGRILDAPGPVSEEDAARIGDLCRLTAPGHHQVIGMVADAAARLAADQH